MSSEQQAVRLSITRPESSKDPLLTAYRLLLTNTPYAISTQCLRMEQPG